MSGERGLTRSMTGATRVLGLMFSLLCLANCLLDRDTLLEELEAALSIPLKINKLRQALDKAEASREALQSVSETLQEMSAEYTRHSESMQDIIARAPPPPQQMMDMKMDMKLLYQDMDTGIAKNKQLLLDTMETNELLKMMIAQAKSKLESLSNDEL